jgi:hypothetical protein
LRFDGRAEIIFTSAFSQVAALQVTDMEVVP